ncbi:DUF6193 family natural product biosynthesis protein [Kitasatospora sp. NPDC018058]|uniref:DUF6193 family natural product biosynthesis protein n=1 Tax=Kitasatospora sp. NPDC018058 TaxID=3364025 RepID=UPI0037C08DC6
MKPDLYPELLAAGTLAAALERTAAELAVDLTVLPGNWGDTSAAIAAAVPERKPLHVHIGAEQRWFGVTGWSRGVQMITGGATELRDIVRAAVAWGSGDSLRELRDRLPFLEFTELAEAHERGPAAAVGVQWRRIREEAAEEPEFTEFGLLVEAAHAEPRLRQLYPFSSHWVLGFRGHTGVPSRAAVAIVPAHNGRPYRVQRFPHEGLIAEAATAQEAVALAVAHLPADLGPAVAGSEEDG